MPVHRERRRLCQRLVACDAGGLVTMRSQPQRGTQAGAGLVAGDVALCLPGRADSGGSNGARLRLWKVELAKLAADTGVAITVCHLPPGTSKWNQIEHRMFSHISMQLPGRTCVVREIVALIGATTTRAGLTVHAELDEGSYPKGVKITDKHMTALPLTAHKFHGDWNYTLNPSHDP